MILSVDSVKTRSNVSPGGAGGVVQVDYTAIETVAILPHLLG